MKFFMAVAALLLSGTANLAAAQASDVAAQLAPLASTSVELPESDRFTLFAPSDEAFSGVVDMLPAGDALAEILVNHVAQGYFTSPVLLEQLAGQTLDSPGGGLNTFLGEGALTVRQDGMTPPSIYVTAAGQELPGAKVTTADIETCAGVIHIIDKVLIATAAGPVSVAPALESDEAVAPAAGEVRCRPGLLAPGAAAPPGFDDYDPGLGAPVPAPLPGAGAGLAPPPSTGVSTGAVDDVAAQGPADSGTGAADTVATREAGDLVADPSSVTATWPLYGVLVGVATGLLAIA